MQFMISQFNFMKSLFLLLTFFLFAAVSGQEKKNFGNSESLLMSINPPPNISSWMLISNVDGIQNSIYSTKKMENYQAQESGFQLNTSGNQFYYIVYIESGNVKYIKDLTALRSFVGTIDNAEEAAIIAITEGYFLDAEFHHLAGNYINQKDKYIVELAKVTSTSCPLSKSHYELTIDKKSGKITSTIDNGVYNEIFDKTCENNPRNAEILQQIEDAKAKKAEEAKEAKIMRDKMKKKQAKAMRRN